MKQWTATGAAQTNDGPEVLLDKEYLRRQAHWLYSVLYHNSELEGEAGGASFYSESKFSAGSGPFTAR